MSIEDLLSKLPVLNQRQDSVIEQLNDLRKVANRLGMYDAADAIRQLFETDKISTLKYGCHVDLEEGMEPDGCVIDEGQLHNCTYAKPGMRKEQCEYWRVCKSQ